MEYNFYKPHILGQEWVPIREDNGGDISYLPQGTQEFGNSFTLYQSRLIQDARVFSKEPKTGFTMVNIYPEEDIQSMGPVRSVLIPVNNSAMTGTSFAFTGGSDGAECLLTMHDSKYVSMPIAVNSTTTSGYFRAYFGVNQYAQLLNGKRILAVNFLYAQSTRFETVVETFTPSANSEIEMTIRLSLLNQFTSSPELAALNAEGTNPGVIDNRLYGYTVDTDSIDLIEIFRVNSGNMCFRSTVPLTTPWTYTELQRFEISATDRLAVQFDWTTNRGDSTTTATGVTNRLHYLAMEVIYCEETRVASGILGTGPILSTSSQNPEAVIVPMYTIPNRAANPPLTAGSYVATVESASPADAFVLSQEYQSWQIKGLRELYPIPSFNSYQISVPTPLDDTIDDKTVTVTNTVVVPQLTLHTTGGAVLTEVHPYGDQAKAQVYGSVTATQQILDSGISPSRSYPWVRFYARRFGETAASLRVDSPSSFPTAFATIAPNEFDDLPAIVDGWKEVTLSITNAPTMGTGANPTWRFSAANEEAENRWEVLGAAAPAISATPGNLLNQFPTVALLGPATYGAPVSGSQVNLGWVPGISPYVSGTTADPQADAVLIFSTNPETPLSLAVSPTSMALAPVDDDCGVTEACIPSALSYNQLSWAPVSGASFDSFNRIAASGWGSTDVGQAWTAGGTIPLANYLVNGSYGQAIHPANSSSDSRMLADVKTPYVEISADFNVDTDPTNGTFPIIFGARATDSDNHVRAVVSTATTGTMTLLISKRVAAVTTTIASAVTLQAIFSTQAWYTVKFRAGEGVYMAKAWPRDEPEPTFWQVVASDSTVPFGTNVIVGATQNSTTAGATTVSFENFEAQSTDFGAIEIQRYDPVDGEFNTIMLSTNAATTGFSDYEARVDQQSVYRIRQRNAYDFAGLWSTQVTGTIPSPGVTGASTSLMLFTSNYLQDGSLNLAYSAEWEGRPIEQFRWSEADQVTLQMMYGKNFPTAFHALERGGEAFSRNILVGAAGIPETVKANGFRDLRDMAWASAPYICVRDELGNRWYSLVTVPEGSRRRMVSKGHLLIATVNVVEVTETPYPVDP